MDVICIVVRYLVFICIMHGLVHKTELLDSSRGMKIMVIACENEFMLNYINNRLHYLWMLYFFYCFILYGLY